MIANSQLTTHMNGFYQAISDYRYALQLIPRLQLGKFFIVPALLSLFIGIGIFILTIGVGDNVGNWLASLYPFEFGRSWMQMISRWLGYLLVAFLALFTFRYILVIFLAPVLSPLSLRVEKHLSGNLQPSPWSPVQFLAEVRRSLRINLRNIFREIMFTILLFILHWIPVIGWFSGIVILMVQSYYSGFGNMDFTLERHLDYRNTIQFVRNNRGLAIGNGAVFILMLMIPVVGLLVALPLSVVAATISAHRRLQKGREGFDKSHFIEG